MKRTRSVIAAGMVVLYVALAIGAVACRANPIERGAHHHHSQMTHSALCAWACQANPTIGLLIEVPPVVLLQLVSLLTLLQITVPARPIALIGRSRAPPGF